MCLHNPDQRRLCIIVFKYLINIFRPSPTIYFFKRFFPKIPATKSNILRHDWRKFESNKFISDFDQIDWEKILYGEKSDVDFLMNQYRCKIDSLLETHAPLKMLNKKELKFFT